VGNVAVRCQRGAHAYLKIPKTRSHRDHRPRPCVRGECYRDLLDLQIVRRTSNPLIGDAVLLSGDPADEDHELVLLTNRSAEHIAFRVHTLEQLRVPYALDSGIALSFFVRDPEDNAVEVYLARSQPRHDQPPLTDPDEIDELMLAA